MHTRAHAICTQAHKYEIDLIAFDLTSLTNPAHAVPTVGSHISAVVAWPCVSARMYPRLLRHHSSGVVSVSKSSAHAWRNNVQRGVHLAYSIRHYTCRTALPYAHSCPVRRWNWRTQAWEQGWESEQRAEAAAEAEAAAAAAAAAEAEKTV